MPQGTYCLTSVSFRDPRVVSAEVTAARIACEAEAPDRRPAGVRHVVAGYQYHYGEDGIRSVEPIQIEVSTRCAQ